MRSSQVYQKLFFSGPSKVIIRGGTRGLAGVVAPQCRRICFNTLVKFPICSTSRHKFTHFLSQYYDFLLWILSTCVETFKKLLRCTLMYMFIILRDVIIYVRPPLIKIAGSTSGYHWLWGHSLDVPPQDSMSNSWRCGAYKCHSYNFVLLIYG